MLKKIFKYEWKATSRMLLVIHGIVLLFAMLSRITLEVSGALENPDGLDVLAAILLMASMMIVGSSMLITWVYIGYRFYKSVFTEQGYLTNTLPVTQNQIIVGKGLVGVLWIVLNACFAVAAILFLAASGVAFELLKELPRLLQCFVMKETALFCWLLLITIVLSPILLVLEMYFCVAVGNLSTGHKVLATLGTFAAVYAVEQIISIVLMLLTGFQSASIESQNMGAELNYQMAMMNTLNINLALGLVISVISIVGFYLGTRYIMKKKLNLQ